MITPSLNFAVNNKFYSIKIYSHYTHSTIDKITGLIQLHILGIVTNISKTSVSVSSGVPNTEKVMKA